MRTSAGTFKWLSEPACLSASADFYCKEPAAAAIAVPSTIPAPVTSTLYTKELVDSSIAYFDDVI